MLENNKSSLLDKSTGDRSDSAFEKPNMTFIHDLKKKVGPSKYKNINRNIDSSGNRSKKKLKNKNSETKNMEPGKPKNIKLLSSVIRKSFGHIKLIPLISVSNRVLNLRAIASTNKKELVDNSAWLINIQKLANIKLDCPLTTHIVNQCISTTVE